MAPDVELPGIFLSTQPAGPRERRMALAVVLASAAIFLAAAPFARAPLPRVSAFIPTYQSALVINDFITAVLLISQIGTLRSRALLVLAGGYFFNALMAILHGLSFPGLFAPEGVIGGGPQTTAWLHIFWHAGFPLAVVAYVGLKNEKVFEWWHFGRVGPTIALAITGVVALVGALTLIVTVGEAWLPVVSLSDHHTDATNAAVTTVSIFELDRACLRLDAASPLGP
jgi:two-component system sensor histidine kinase UhpB